MSWLILILAGLFEVVWAVGLKFTDGFSKPLPSVITLAAMGASFYFLSLAMKALPLGVAYSVWVGVGMVGAVIVGIMAFNESVSVLKLVSVLLIISGIIGLKLSSVQ
ncbi:quaternary ammonium compound efflux SMR transporter SugE [Alteromonas antoniana]|uniref:quaternary ammonium compound efflux SMR transporter SugE n=1 Tax=Alteromonas antoniana TaxID=2803813 RepID=UPI001C44A3D8|nr:quaternary ammonium compound efflux SMR transporter SugE [Alteromonas antoniana]